MTRSPLLRTALAAAVVLGAQVAPAEAQSVLTYVSTAGDDGNLCASVTSPCRTLSGALLKTIAGGKVTILDSGEFQSATIDQSVSIVAAPGVDATLFVGVTTKLTVAAGPNDVVYLDGLHLRRFVPGSGGNSGIRFLSGRALQVSNCTIQGFGEAGIFIEAPGPSQVIVSNSTIIDNNTGIWARQVGAGSVVRVLLDGVTIARNALFGVRALRSSTHVRISGSTITDNTIGIRSSNDARLTSFGNNILIGNGDNGEFTGLASLR